MAIVWGAWDSYNRHRTGMDIVQSPATVTSATTSVTLTIYNYFQTRYWGNDSGLNWAISGNASASGTKSFNHSNDMDYTLMGTATVTVTLNYGATQSKSFSASNSGWVSYPSTSSVSRSWTVPARPYSTPAAPTAVTATRVSDTSQTITWTRNATTGAPYDNQYVERWDNVTNAYATIATVSGTATSYSNTNTVANRQYRYRVRAKNSVAYSGYNYSAYIKTTPAAPGTPTATKDASGNIVLTWGSNPAIGENIEVWHLANGVRDASPLATLGMVTTYTHASPLNTQTHAYQLRAKVTSPALTSAYSATSNTVQLLAPPNAPTSLSPTGAVADATQAISLSWQHNPVDTTPQTKYQVQRRVNGGAWTLGSITTSATAASTFASNTFTNGQLVEWQVRTWGAATTGGSDGTGASPWSTTANITLSSPPSGTINTPADAGTVATSTLDVTWGYFDAEGTAQTQWIVKLYDASGNLLETKTGSDASTSVTMGTQLADATTYRVDLQVRDSAGSWSAVDSATFSVAYAKPPQPQVNPMWDEENGLVGVEVLVGSAGAGEVEAVYLRVWRSLDAGTTWLLVSDNVMPGSTVADLVPPLNSTVTYMAEAVSALPSVRRSTNVDVFTSCAVFNRVWVNAGSGFTTSCFLSPECDVTVAGGKEVDLVQYSGRGKPVEYSSPTTSETVNVKGVIVRDNDEPYIATSSFDDWRSLIKNFSAPMCLRDLRGHRWFVSISDFGYDGMHRKMQAISFVATEIDWSEPRTVA